MIVICCIIVKKRIKKTKEGTCAELKRKRYKKTKKRNLFWFASRVVITALVIGCGVSFVVTKSKCAEMQKELDSIDKKTGELEAENVELQRILDDGDMNAYMEKIAIENMNYAYPNERRYYDTSRN